MIIYKKLLKLLQSTIFIFVFTKYFSLGLQFFNTVASAKFLGLYFFGILGFLKLMMQYFSYSNLGVNFSMNVIISSKKELVKENCEKVINASLFVSVITSIGLLILFIILDYFDINIGNKYSFFNYYIIVIGIVFFKQLNVIFTNVFRISNRFLIINLSYLIPASVELILLICFKGEKLLFYLLIGMLISQMFLTFLFLIHSPFRISTKMEENIVFIIKRGLYLLIYNMSFYLILMVSRSFVSYYCDVTEFSIFNFSYQISEAVVLLTGAVSFMFFPKLLNKFSNMSTSETLLFIKRIREAYLNLTYLTIAISFIFIPLVYLFLPKYEESFFTVVLLLISQLFVSNLFGHNTLLIHRNKERKLIFMGAKAIVVISVLAIIANYCNYFSSSTMAVIVVLGMAYYNFCVSKSFYEEFNIRVNIRKHFFKVFNFRKLIPFVVYFILLLIEANNLISTFICLFTLITFNVKSFYDSFCYIKKRLLNNSILEIEIKN